MQNGKNYLFYICCSIFTLIGIYNLSDSLINPDIDSTEKILFIERFQYFNSILFFGGLGYVYYILKKYGKTYSGNFTKVSISLLFASSIFIVNCLFLILHPEEYTRGSKLFKLIIGYTGLVFFGLGFIVSLNNLLKKNT